MHKLLTRQLRRYGAEISQEDNLRLFQAISDAYVQNEQGMDILERSLFITSNELNEKNANLSLQLSELSQTQQQLKEYAARLNAIFDATGEVIIAFDRDANISHYNQEALKLLTNGDEKELRHWKPLLELCKEPEVLEYELERLKQEPAAELSGYLELKDNRQFEYRSSAQMSEQELIGRVWCLRDVTLQRHSESIIQYQAYHDDLTGLPNRLKLNHLISTAIEQCCCFERSVVVLFIDLDDFKKVNDSQGHETGDALLVNVAERLLGCIGDKDVLARFGGDEFIVLLENVAQAGQAEQVCQALLASMSSPFIIEQHSFYVSCSIGISIATDNTDLPEVLIRQADMAMYRAKQKGKNNYQFYDEYIENEALRALELERQLRLAIENDELIVYFQPKINLQNMQLVGVEALVRWQQSNGSLVSPADFIPLAERVGLIDRIGEVVFEKTCQQLSQWNEMGFTQVKVAINLSALEFADSELELKIQRGLAKYNIEAEQLILEVTESLFMENRQQIEQKMRRLQQLGVSFSLDDFGTGYSSFSYLQELALDYLKIDRSFVCGVVGNNKKTAIVRSIIDVGRNLGLTLVAEGIEDAETLDFICEHAAGEILAQGYYLYKPMPGAQLTLLLQELDSNKKL